MADFGLGDQVIREDDLELGSMLSRKGFDLQVEAAAHRIGAAAPGEGAAPNPQDHSAPDQKPCSFVCENQALVTLRPGSFPGPSYPHSVEIDLKHSLS